MKNGKRRNIDSRTRKTAAAPPPDPRDAELVAIGVVGGVAIAQAVLP